MSPTPRPGILEVTAYVGGESKAPGGKPPVRLASNENPLGPSPAAVAAYEAAAAELHRYPDGASAELRQVLGAQHGLEPERIVCGAGSDELIVLLARAYAGPGDEVLHSAHGFLMYGIAARTAGAAVVTAPEANLTADVDALLARVTPRTRILFLANPNNPTGTYLPAAELERLHAGLPPEVLLVVDAAYAEYVTESDYADGARLVAAHDNVVMTRTFSKIYGLAALRLGWTYAAPRVTDLLNRLRGPFNVTAPAQVAGVAALQDQDYVRVSRETNARVLESFAGRLQALGIEVAPSVGNFLLASFPEAATTIGQLKQRGILVRAMAGYGLPDCLRISIGTEDEMAEVAEVMSELFG